MKLPLPERILRWEVKSLSNAERGPSGPRIVIGRDPSCTFVLRHKRVSRKHCGFRGLTVENYSANGTYVDGRLIRDEAPVSHGSIVSIANFDFVVVAVPHAVRVDDDWVEDDAGPFHFERRVLTFDLADQLLDLDVGRHPVMDEAVLAVQRLVKRDSCWQPNRLVAFRSLDDDVVAGLGPAPTVVIVFLGAERQFRFGNVTINARHNSAVALEDGAYNNVRPRHAGPLVRAHPITGEKQLCVAFVMDETTAAPDQS